MLIDNPTLLKHSDEFIKAAKDKHVNEVYLISHALLETGSAKSELSSGVEIDGKKYYNFFGVGALDEDPIKTGSEYAKKHGWDTPQEDNTDAGSVSSTLSTYSAQYGRHKRVVAPDMFSFSGGDWGRGYEPTLPAHTASRYDTLRRSSISDHPRSDDTVTTYRYEDAPQYGTIPIDTTPKPEFPDRRSSLSAVTKLRKSNPASVQPPVDSPVSKEKKSRIPNLRMFGRGESAPPPSSPTKTSFSQGLPRPKAANPNRS